MNPNSTIRPWILATGKKFGIRFGYEYIRPDDATRQEEPHFVYRLLGSVPDEDGVRDNSTKTGNVVNSSKVKSHINTFQIDLYDSEDGARELNTMCIAAERDDEIKRFFDAAGCRFDRNEGVENLTTFDSERKHYHFRLICTFYENIAYSTSKQAVNDVTFTTTWDGVQ
jgi:hypothetical protein